MFTSITIPIWVSRERVAHDVDGAREAVNSRGVQLAKSGASPPRGCRTRVPDRPACGTGSGQRTNTNECYC